MVIAVSSQLSANNINKCRYDALCYAAAQCNPGHTHKAVRGKKVAGQSGSEDFAYIDGKCDYSWLGNRESRDLVRPIESARNNRWPADASNNGTRPHHAFWHTAQAHQYNQDAAQR